MIITSNHAIKAASIDDLRKQRDEYDAETNRLESINEENELRYRSDIHNKSNEIARAISNLIGSTPLELSIRVRDDWNDAWEVDIRANEGSKFSDKTALSWNWSVKFDNNGTIVKDSGSWSGLKAITPDQLADLEESVRVLKVLNKIDWYMLLKDRFGAKPKFDDYIDSEVSNQFYSRKKSRPNFEEQIQSAQIQEFINSNKALKLSQDQRWRGTCWIIPTGVSDKFVTGYIFPDYYLSRNYTVDEIKESADKRRTSLSNLIKDWETKEYEVIDLA